MEYCMSDCDRCPIIDSEWKLLLHRADAFCLLFIPATVLITILHQQVMSRGRQSATTPPPAHSIPRTPTFLRVSAVLHTSNSKLISLSHHMCPAAEI